MLPLTSIFHTIILVKNINGLILSRKVYIPGDNYEKVEVPLPEGQLTFFSNNEFRPECCSNNTISGSNGCPCITTEQKNYLGSRGGNKAFTQWDKTF